MAGFDRMSEHESDGFPDDLIRVYRETVGDLYRYVARRSGGSRELAEDVTQEAYLRAMKVWSRRGLPDCPIAWLRTVAHNLLRNHYRRRQPLRLDAADIDAMLGSTAVESDNTASVVCWGLSRLAHRKARLLESFYLDGQTVRDLARDLGVTERAVEGRLRRAREALKKLLAPHVGVTGASI